MLTIRKEQKQALEAAAMDRFIVECKRSIEQNAPEWCADKSDEDKQEFVEQMIDFAHDCHLFKEHIIRQLIYYKIEYDFPIPLSPYRRNLLDREEFDEDYRIGQFHDSLSSDEDEMTLINLENEEENN